MSLPSFSGQASFYDVHNLLGDDFAPDDRFRLFSELIYPLLLQARPALAACYCQDNGRPAEEPVLMLGILVLQFMERLPDRQAMERMRLDLGWKLALRQELKVQAPDASVLTLFRQRLVEHGQAKLAFDTVLKGLMAAGLVKRGGKRRLDSTHVLGAVARMSALECLRETLRLALEEVEKMEGVKRPEFWEVLWERYVESRVDYRLKEEALAEKHLQGGRDGLLLTEWAAGQGKEVKWGERMELLRRVLGEQFEVVEGQLKRQRRRAQSVQNPHDAESQWSSKRKTGKEGWTGYKLQASESIGEGPREEGQPPGHFLTGMETQEATEGELAGMKQVEEAEKASGLGVPEERHVDSGYVSAEQIKEEQEKGTDLVGPALGASRQREGYGTEDFQVDVARRKAVCPEGRENSGCSRITDKESGKVSYRFDWGSQCRQCPMREACMGPEQKERGRSLEVGEHYEYLRRRREEQESEAYRQRMHQRAGIEGTISELVRAHGGRRSRYRGLAKTRLQNYLIGAACNIKRLVRLLGWGVRRGVSVVREAVEKAVLGVGSAPAAG